jgi:hypothetical protein
MYLGVSGNCLEALSISPDIVFAAMSETVPAQSPKRLFQVSSLQFGLYTNKCHTRHDCNAMRSVTALDGVDEKGEANLSVVL